MCDKPKILIDSRFLNIKHPYLFYSPAMHIESLQNNGLIVKRLEKYIFPIMIGYAKVMSFVNINIGSKFRLKNIPLCLFVN